MNIKIVYVIERIEELKMERIRNIVDAEFA